MCQWRFHEDEHFIQYETDDFFKVMKELEKKFNLKIDSIATYSSGVIRLDLDYVSVYVSSEMEKLIDCEVLT